MKKVGCRHCYPPDGVPAQPVIVEPPPAPTLQEQYDRQCWRDKAWEVAGVGASADVAAKVFDLQLPHFLGMVEHEFGATWVEVLERARFKVLVKLQTKAISLATEKGNWKPILMLEQQGLMPSFGQTREEVSQAHFDTYAKMPNAEIQRRLRAALDTRTGMEKHKASPTLSIREPEPGECIAGGNLEPFLDGSSKAEFEASMKAHESAKPIEELVEVIPEPTPVVMNMDHLQAGPSQGSAVSNPKPGMLVLGRNR